MKLESNIYSNQNNNIVMRTMKHFLSLLLLLVINIHAYASDDGVIRILAIGNSFSQDAIENYLHQLAEASGKQTIIANMYIGGCTLERHYNNAQNNTAAYSYRKIGVDGMKVSKEGVTLETALTDEKWDYVTNYSKEVLCLVCMKHILHILVTLSAISEIWHLKM